MYVVFRQYTADALSDGLWNEYAFDVHETWHKSNIIWRKVQK